MKVIYIIGPFRAENSWEVEQNVRRAEAVALEIWRMGAVPICVHAMCRNYTGAAPDDVWLKGDLELLKRSDAAFVMPAIEGSSGSQDEVTLCDERGMLVFTNLRNLKTWLYHARVVPGGGAE